MKIFKDDALSQETTSLDMGIVLGGTTKTVTYYLYNELDVEVVDITVTVPNTNVDVSSFPVSLKSKESGKVIFSWTPPKDVKKGLKTALNVNYFELYED